MGIVRVRPDVASVVFDEKTGGFVSLGPHQPMDSADPVVKANKWAFESDDDAVARHAQAGRIVAVNLDEYVEQATATPGEKRHVRRVGEMTAAPTAAASADLSNFSTVPTVDAESSGPITAQSWGAAVPGGSSGEGETSVAKSVNPITAKSVNPIKGQAKSSKKG